MYATPTHQRMIESISWDDLVIWAGSKVASRGREYQREGRVKDLAVTDDGGLVASVAGSRRYSVQVRMDADGILESRCSCPYELDCKHGVATVLEYLSRAGQGRPVPRAAPGDKRLTWTDSDELDDEGWEGGSDYSSKPALPGEFLEQVATLLKEKTQAELVDVILGFAEAYPEVASALQDTVQLRTGDVASLTARLRREIREVSSRPGWQGGWDNEGYTPDYSGIRGRLETLLASGHADAVLSLGQELIGSGSDQVESSEDEGETAMEVSRCIAVLPRALVASSLPEAERLLWALDAVIDDPFDLCDDLSGYLMEEHPAAAWGVVADTLLKRLGTGNFRAGNFDRDSQRDRISDWTIHALERAGRGEEIVPLCESETGKTASYNRLVDRLIALERYADAERWIRTGVEATRKNWPGKASRLQEALLTIKARQQDWPAVAALHVEDFVHGPSARAFTNCKDAAERLDAWTSIRPILLEYLAGGRLPWKQSGWPLPVPVRDAPKPERRDTLPRVSILIEIAIQEKNPEDVLRWYDRCSRGRFVGHGSLDDDVATAVAAQAPDRAVAIWKAMAEREISRVTPSAYHEAAGYLRKAAKVMLREKKAADWNRYLATLRTEHLRKKRLLEILDTLSAEPILKKRQ
jgi:uncharacterized Zn finger protein